MKQYITVVLILCTNMRLGVCTDFMPSQTGAVAAVESTSPVSPVLARVPDPSQLWGEEEKSSSKILGMAIEYFKNPTSSSFKDSKRLVRSLVGELTSLQLGLSAYVSLKRDPIHIQAGERVTGLITFLLSLLPYAVNSYELISDLGYIDKIIYSLTYLSEGLAYADADKEKGSPFS